MACAKQKVVCVIMADDGRVFLGTNDCIRPQPVCPREPGEDYRKCVIVCLQPWHAEIGAIIAWREAGCPPARAYIFGHIVICPHCEEELKVAGIPYTLVVP